MLSFILAAALAATEPTVSAATEPTVSTTTEPTVSAATEPTTLTATFAAALFSRTKSVYKNRFPVRVSHVRRKLVFDSFYSNNRPEYSWVGTPAFIRQRRFPNCIIVNPRFCKTYFGKMY